MSQTLILTTSYPSHPDDPAGNFVAAEAALERARGCEVVVLTPGRLTKASANKTKPSATVRVLPLGGLALFGSPGAIPRLRSCPLRLVALAPVVLRLYRALRDLNRSGFTPTHTIAHWLVPMGWLAAKLSRPRGSQLTIVVHGSDARLLRQLPAPLARAILNTLVKRDARLRLVSRQLATELLAIPGLPDATRHWVRDAELRPCALSLPRLDRQQARKHLGLPLNERHLVVVARLVTSKRVETALAAAALVPKAHVTVVGDGPHRPALQRAFPEVNFAGALPRTEALAWIAAADLLLSASYLEGAPTVVREARLLGVSVVATPAGDLEGWANRDPCIWLAGES